nr:AAA family ATPase [uncultured Macellibacteroides sp.]
MNITRIKIDNLFDTFSYDIDFKEKGNLSILTGPNGYGKTTILLIINNLYSNNFYYFQELDFKSIQLYWEKEYSILITKNFPEADPSVDNGFTSQDAKVSFILFQQEAEQARFNFDPSEFVKGLESNSNLRYRNDTWYDRRTDCSYSTNELIGINTDILGEIKYSTIDGTFSLFLSSLNSYLIKDQRLSFLKDSRSSSSFYSTRKSEYSIAKDASELADEIKKVQLGALKKAQILDSTFPKRLLECVDSFTEEEYRNRFKALLDNQAVLKKYGLSTTSQFEAEYNESSKKTLSVYLKDAEYKVAEYKELVDKLELFANIVKSKDFTNKDLFIDTEKGFYFKTKKERNLNPEDLSSGEQHELILLYDLLFRAEPDTVVLIDEPEISLHVTWQQEFIGDLLRITKIKNVQLIIATHSPQIVGNHWDLSYDLYENNLLS